MRGLIEKQGFEIHPVQVKCLTLFIESLLKRMLLIIFVFLYKNYHLSN